MSLEVTFGYIGALVASIFFGSNYVPTKNYPQGDGFTFVWVFSSGVMTVGIFSLFFVDKAIFVYSGLLGGSLWATGNMCVIPIVKLIGLGLGLLLWGSTSLVTGFVVGKFGLFGLHPDAVRHDGMNWGGIVCIIVAMGVFFFIKPTLEDDKIKKERAPLIGKDQFSKGHLQDVVVGVDGLPEEETSIFDRIPPNLKYIVGVGMAMGSGILYGVNMVPMKLWVQKQTKPPGSLDFVLSHFIGIYLYSTVVFLGYCIYKRPPQIFAQSILPSYVSGAMWGVAQCGLMAATQILGYTTGFPIGSTGPLIVSSLWSVFYFREIRGMKNYLFLSGSFALLITGLVLLALSH